MVTADSFLLQLCDALGTVFKEPHSEEIIMYEYGHAANRTPQKCICDIKVLFSQGCVCGGAKVEMEAAGRKPDPFRDDVYQQRADEWGISRADAKVRMLAEQYGGAFIISQPKQETFAETAEKLVKSGLRTWVQAVGQDSFKSGDYVRILDRVLKIGTYDAKEDYWTTISEPKKPSSFVTRASNKWEVLR